MSPEIPKSKPESTISRQNSVEPTKLKPEPIQEDVKENEAEDEEGLQVYPYDRLKTTSTDPVADIDVTKREVCMREVFYFFLNQKGFCVAFLIK